MAMQIKDFINGEFFKAIFGDNRPVADSSGIVADCLGGVA